MISIICPTRNESENIRLLIKKIHEHVKIKHEIIFVDDDSTDGTVKTLKEFSKKNSDIRVISRFQEKNYSSALALGISSAIYDYAAIVDADLQHDIKNIEKMYRHAKKNNLDIVISSRFKEIQKLGLSKFRVFLSKFSNSLINKVIKLQLTDPGSGCFLIKVSLFNTLKKNLILKGYKILFDILCCCDISKIKIDEISLKFHSRKKGESKLGSKIILQFLINYSFRFIDKYIPIRFIKFCFVGLIGVGIHLTILNSLLEFYQMNIGTAQFLSALVTMNFNFYFNNIFTFKNEILKKINYLKGTFKYIIFCSFGAIISASVAEYLYGITLHINFSAFIGIVFGSITNYVLNYRFTWNAKK